MSTSNCDQCGGCGTIQGEPCWNCNKPDSEYSAVVHAFTNYPVKIIWIDSQGNRKKEETINFEQP